MNFRFYLAAGYSRMAEMRNMARQIERHSDWKCSSRWLDGSHDRKPREVAAAEDIADVEAADVLVIFHGPSTRGGKWVELGLALGFGMPVLLVDGNNQPPEPPVFAYPKELVTWAKDGAVPREIADWLRDQDDKLAAFA